MAMTMAPTASMFFDIGIIEINTTDPAQKLSRLRPYINLIEESVVMGGEVASEFWLRSAMWFAKASQRYR